MKVSRSRVVSTLACVVALAGTAACGGEIAADPSDGGAMPDGGSHGGQPSGSSGAVAGSSGGVGATRGGRAGGSSSGSGGGSSGGSASGSSSGGGSGSGSSSGGSSGSSSGSGGSSSGSVGGDTPPPSGTSPGPNGTTIIDPQWGRTSEYFLAPFSPDPDLQYYTANTYPLYNEDNSDAGSSFTWTTVDAWNGPGTNDYVDGPGPIPGFIPNDTWFYTYDRVGDGVTGTSYWFRANVDLGSLSSIGSIQIEDKFFPGVMAVNDGLILFLNGVPQQIMHCAPGDAATYLSPGLDADWSTGVATCPLETFYPQTGPGPGWAFVAPDLPLSALHDGTNEIAILFEERNGAGGLDHPVLVVTPANDAGTAEDASSPGT
jgi:hypothetical protein